MPAFHVHRHPGKGKPKDCAGCHRHRTNHRENSATCCLPSASPSWSTAEDILIRDWCVFQQIHDYRQTVPGGCSKMYQMRQMCRDMQHRKRKNQGRQCSRIPALRRMYLLLGLLPSLSSPRHQLRQDYEKTRAILFRKKWESRCEDTERTK